MKRFLLVLVLLAVSGVAAALTIPSSCETALRRTLDADAEWRMERLLTGAARPLVSKGVVSCFMDRGIIWETRAPIASTATMTTNSVVFIDRHGRQEKPLAELPHYATIRRQAEAFLAGDDKAFDEYFAVDTEMTDDGSWRLTFRPVSWQLKRFITDLVVTITDARVTKVVIRSEKGGTSTITFRETGWKTHALWKDAAP